MRMLSFFSTIRSSPIAANMMITRSRDNACPSVWFAFAQTSATNTVPSTKKLPVGGDEFQMGRCRMRKSLVVAMMGVLAAAAIAGGATATWAQADVIKERQEN